jgi:hypothetical protein
MLPSSVKKTFAMQHFVTHIRNFIHKTFPEDVKNIPLTVGFSDDSPVNIQAMYEFFQNERKEPKYFQQEDKLRLYYTGPENPALHEQIYDTLPEQRSDFLVIRL